MWMHCILNDRSVTEDGPFKRSQSGEVVFSPQEVEKIKAKLQECFKLETAEDSQTFAMELGDIEGSC